MPQGNKERKLFLLLHEVHKVIDLGKLVSFERALLVKYEVPTSNSSKVMAQIKADSRQTIQKQHAPDHMISRGIMI